MPPEALYRIYESTWRNMDRENNLVNQRISWSLVLTAGFLTAETFLLARVFEILSKDSAHINVFVVLSFLACAILSALATAVCYRVHQGVGAAFDQIQTLEDKYKELARRFEQEMSLPRPYGQDVASFRGHSAARIFPFVMTGVWALFATVQLLAAVLIQQIV